MHLLTPKNLKSKIRRGSLKTVQQNIQNQEKNRTQAEMLIMLQLLLICVTEQSKYMHEPTTASGNLTANLKNFTTYLDTIVSLDANNDKTTMN